MKELTLEARNENLDKVVDFVNEQLAVYTCTTSTLKKLEMAIDAVVELENGKDLGGASVDTGVSTVTKENVAAFK